MRNGERLRRVVEAAVTEGVVIPAFNIPYLPMVEATARALQEYDVFGMIEVARLETTKYEAGSLAHMADEYRK